MTGLKPSANGVKMKYLSVCTGTGAIWDPDAADFATMNAVLAMHTRTLNLLRLMLLMLITKTLADFISRLRDRLS